MSAYNCSLEKDSGQIEVTRPKPVTYFNQTPTFEWYVRRCGSKNGHKITCVDWIFCSKFVYYHTLNSQVNWGHLYDNLRRKRISTLIMDKIAI